MQLNFFDFGISSIVVEVDVTLEAVGILGRFVAPVG